VDKKLNTNREERRQGTPQTQQSFTRRMPNENKVLFFSGKNTSKLSLRNEEIVSSKSSSLQDLNFFTVSLDKRGRRSLYNSQTKY
jgi:hypothetical protein